MIVASLALMVAGIISTQHTDIDVFPDLTAPTVVVMTEAHGMAAEEVEQLVTFPIESTMNGATHVRRVRSTSTHGFSVVWVEFNWNTDIYLARQIVSERLALVNETLPPNVSRATMGPQSSIMGEVMIIGLTATESSMMDLRTIADWTIRPRLLSVGGVAQVSVHGGDIKEYQILINPAKMRHYGVTLEQVLNATQNMCLNVNGGVINEFHNEYIVRGILSTTNIETIAQTPVTIGSNGNTILLRDIADVQIGAEEPKLGVASVNGQPAVLLTVSKQPNTSTLELTENLERVMAELESSLPEDVEVNCDIFRQSSFIENSIDNIRRALIEGAIFVVIVLFLFLANVRSTIISLLTIPISLLISLLTLHLLGFSINTMSLGGMTIAIGALVDDAIVDVENVWKRIRENSMMPKGKRQPLLRVVYDASREVRTPILNSTLIIVVSFFPLFFLGGIEGRMLKPLGIAFIVALFASTLVALTLTPVLCSYMLYGKRRREKGEPRFVLLLKRGYKIALEWALKHSKGVVSTTIVLLIASMFILFNLGRSFLPPFNEGSLTINVTSLPGITLEESDNIGKEVERLLLSLPEITTVARKTGRAEMDEHLRGVNGSEIEAPYHLANRSKGEMMEELRHKLSQIKGANIEIGQPISHRIDAMLSGTKATIAIKLFGDNLNTLYHYAKEIEKSISSIDGLVDINVEQQVERPQLTINPKRDMMAQYGITMPQFSTFVSANIAGSRVSQIFEGNRAYNIVVRAENGSRESAEGLKDLMIDTYNGERIPLGYIADIRSTMGPNSISRENVKRKIVISANREGIDLRGAVKQIKSSVQSDVILPEGYYIEYGGQAESEESASRKLLFASALSIIVIFLLLYMQFKSIRESLIILLNLPFALIGGIFMLYLSGGEINIPAIIGFISLFGIATRNGMLLISHYNELQSRGTPLNESILQGSLDRLNPILMTALSSALALVPLALQGGLPGNEIQSPMAKVILGGLLSSTLLNAFLVPIIYRFTNRKV